METLRKAMQKDLPNSGHIHLVVARRRKPTHRSNLIPDTQESTDMRISASDFPIEDLSSNNSEPTDEMWSTNDDQVTMTGNTNMSINPLDRVRNGDGLRNTSYQRATNESGLGEGDTGDLSTSPRPTQTMNVKMVSQKKYRQIVAQKKQ